MRSKSKTALPVQAGTLGNTVSKPQANYTLFPNKCQLNKAIRISSLLYLGIICITLLVVEVLK